jgi:hypothetical protein
MKIPKKLFSGAFFLLCLAVSPLWSQQLDEIAPPLWIQGLWQYTEDGEAYTTRFGGSDIFFDAESAAAFIAQGVVTGFTQTLTDSYYEIFFEFSDGYWWKERFPKPRGDSLESVFENSDGDNSSIEYTRKTD